MNRFQVIRFIAFFYPFVIGVSGLLSGIRRHENWLITMSSVTVALMISAFVIKVVHSFRRKPISKTE